MEDKKMAIHIAKVYKSYPASMFEKNGEEEKVIFLEQEFNSNGYKILETIYDEDGNAEQITTYKYDEHNNIIEEHHQFVNDDTEERTNYHYENGLITSKEKAFSMGAIEKTIYSYNDKKQLVSSKTIDDDGEIEDEQKMEYVGNNLSYHLKNSGLSGKEYEQWLSYDEKNRVIEEKKWEAQYGQTHRIIYNYEKDEVEPDLLIYNAKNSVVEAHIKDFDAKKRLVRTEVQTVQNGLQKIITVYDYDDLDRNIYLETTNHKGELQRKHSSSYNELGLLLEEVKTEYAISNSSLITFTLLYEYTFYQH